MPAPELPYVGSKYGSPMGRRECLPLGKDLPYKFYLSRVPMCSCCGAYDKQGAYWGTGTPLWRAYGEHDDGIDVELFTRAPTRESAKQHVLDQYPNAKFFR